jgi:hypothetical protein
MPAKPDRKPHDQMTRRELEQELQYWDKTLEVYSELMDDKELMNDWSIQGLVDEAHKMYASAELILEQKEAEDANRS